MDNRYQCGAVFFTVELYNQHRKIVHNRKALDIEEGEIIFCRATNRQKSRK